MKLIPLLGRIVVKQLENEEKIKSGTILIVSVQDKPQEAEVVVIGPDGMIDGKENAMQIKKGYNVICSNYAGTEVKLEDKEYNIVHQNDKI